MPKKSDLLSIVVEAFSVLLLLPAGDDSFKNFFQVFLYILDDVGDFFDIFT